MTRLVHSTIFWIFFTPDTGVIKPTGALSAAKGSPNEAGSPFLQRVSALAGTWSEQEHADFEKNTHGSKSDF